MVRFGLRQHPSEAFVKVSSRFKLLLAVSEKVYCWFCMVRFGLARNGFGLVRIGMF